LLDVERIAHGVLHKFIFRIWHNITALLRGVAQKKALPEFWQGFLLLLKP
jgi:hypothetical protein